MWFSIILNADVAGTDVLKRFELEIKALATLNQEEIATIHGIHRTDMAVLMQATGAICLDFQTNIFL